MQRAIRVLVNIKDARAYVAHIVDQSGHPLCATRLKLIHWQIAEVDPSTVTICNRCRASAAKRL
jgi:hypothetical protein